MELSSTVCSILHVIVSNMFPHYMFSTKMLMCNKIDKNINLLNCLYQTHAVYNGTCTPSHK